MLFAEFASAQTLGQITVPSEKIVQYKKAEWSVISTGDYKNPYDQKEVSMNMILTSPSGKPIILPCYFDIQAGKAVWKARFSPLEDGKYLYHFELESNKEPVLSKEMTFVSLTNGTDPGFLRKNNAYTFKFDNGDLFRGIGENIAWESRSFENDKWTYDYLLPSLSKNGANFFRTWMSYWNLPLEWQKVNMTKRYQNTSAYFNPGAIKRMDELVNMTDSLNLYFMLTLEWHGHFMEKGGWKDSPYNVINGGPAKTPADFFSNDAARDRFKNKLRYCVARWGYSTHIAAWEFFNEVDNAAFTEDDGIIIPLNSIAQWHLEMSRYLKDLDPYQHMVTTSISHRDIIGMNSIPYIDFNQKHIYKHTGKIPAIYKDYISNFGKPYVIGEFGYRWEDADPQYSTAFNYDFKRGLWYGLFSPTPILPMSWWWELFDDEQMAPYFAGVREISDKMLKSGKGDFEPVPVLAKNLETYGLRCGEVTFIYLLNNTKEVFAADVAVPSLTSAAYVIQQYDPETRKYHPLKNEVLNAGGLKLKNFSLAPKQETVLILTRKEK
ncbi:cellulase (glycosyl hydrolase family 5) [Pedobacter cryoconitis]|uniref:Cellulase (Glycosyl hydrolase family 5) n=2 Tax=Pedobacter cryoconitis TaxID=188932 RepID=A0A327S100_9SPHI|nr:cellulase (glycosyl hydrolase family 5) [Pedobacter cryoconitis]